MSIESTERLMWRRLRAAWCGFGIRIEASDGGVEPGTPDTLLQPAGLGGVFVELKVWPTPLRTEQLAWHVDCLGRGGCAVVMCEVGRDSYWIGTGESYDTWIVARQRGDDGGRPPGATLRRSMLVLRALANPNGMHLFVVNYPNGYPERAN